MGEGAARMRQSIDIDAARNGTPEPVPSVPLDLVPARALVIPYQNPDLLAQQVVNREVDLPGLRERVGNQGGRD